MTITGIIMTMYQPRIKLCRQVIDEVKEYYGEKVFDTFITRSVRLSEAPSYGAPIYYYSKYSRSSLQYQDLTKEIINRTGGYLLEWQV